MDVVSIIESKIGKSAIINYEPMQLGDVEKTLQILKSQKKLAFFAKN